MTRSYTVEDGKVWRLLDRLGKVCAVCGRTFVIGDEVVSKKAGRRGTKERHRACAESVGLFA